MHDIVPVKRALISVSDKTDIIPFARALTSMGIEIISTGGTARALADAGIEPTPVDSVTGFPEMMDGRLKTLHPRIHGGLLARRDIEAHVDAMHEHGIVAIDLICINLYPFERTIANPEVSPADAIEQIDIGGPAALRSAAKNHAFVAAVTTPAQYDSVIAELKANDGGTSMALRRELASAAFARTAAYDAAISNWLVRAADDPLPPRLNIASTRVRPLRYGENPHQEAALYTLPGSSEVGLANARSIDGKPLSYNNLNDAAGAMRCCGDLARAFPGQNAVTIIKHASPCGAAVDVNAASAFEKAWAGDPRAAFGSVVAVSCAVDADLAAGMTQGERFIEVVVAPSFDDDAVAALSSRWKNIRLVMVEDLTAVPSDIIDVRSIPGGLLAQSRDIHPIDPSTWTLAAGPEASDATLRDAVLAWIVAKHLPSNAIAIAGQGRLLGGGGGQVDRLTAARIAVEKAGDALGGDAPAVAASDAFFPFSDGPEALITAGVTCIVQPGGSRRDDETFDVCTQHGVSCLLTGVRHFRH